MKSMVKHQYLILATDSQLDLHLSFDWAVLKQENVVLMSTDVLVAESLGSLSYREVNVCHGPQSAAASNSSPSFIQ